MKPCTASLDPASLLRSAPRSNGSAQASEPPRLVPRALTERLHRGQSIEAGEREVSVLFADLRGYAGFAEQHRPSDVFRTVARYAQITSRVVHDYRGLIVDFCGDGIMAVFGALEPIPSKERSALATAREICARVAESPPFAGGPASGLCVGVGVATGNAYVGEIRAVDQTFWSAVGSTTNLASRLQHLTRELGCAVAVDTPTFERSGELAVGLERCSRVAIRGLQTPADVYVLPFPTGRDSWGA